MTHTGLWAPHRDAVVAAAQDMRTLAGRTDRVGRRSAVHAAAAPRHFCGTSHMHCTPNNYLVLAGAVCVCVCVSCVLTPLSRAVPPAERLLQACCTAAWHQGVPGLTPAPGQGQRKRHGLSKGNKVCHRSASSGALSCQQTCRGLSVLSCDDCTNDCTSDPCALA